MFRWREIRIWAFLITLTFGRHLDRQAAEMKVNYQSDTMILTSNLAASMLRWYCGKTSVRLVNRDSGIETDHGYTGVAVVTTNAPMHSWTARLLRQEGGWGTDVATYSTANKIFAFLAGNSWAGLSAERPLPARAGQLWYSHLLSRWRHL